ncbi:hypothetical protein JFY74_09320 [Pectobacterium carotovorum]|nr:hypothetical protein JFY74_09320 [Pectobacterium carotovorum]
MCEELVRGVLSFVQRLTLAAACQVLVTTFPEQQNELQQLAKGLGQSLR